MHPIFGLRQIKRFWQFSRCLLCAVSLCSCVNICTERIASTSFLSTWQCCLFLSSSSLAVVSWAFRGCLSFNGSSLYSKFVQFLWHWCRDSFGTSSNVVFRCFVYIFVTEDIETDTASDDSAKFKLLLCATLLSPACHRLYYLSSFFSLFHSRALHVLYAWMVLLFRALLHSA